MRSTVKRFFSEPLWENHRSDPPCRVAGNQIKPFRSHHPQLNLSGDEPGNPERQHGQNAADLNNPTGWLTPRDEFCRPNRILDARGILLFSNAVVRVWELIFTCEKIIPRIVACFSSWPPSSKEHNR